MPLNVDKKLYSATLFVMLMPVKRSVTFVCSPRRRLSVPTLKSNKLRGATRGGFVSSFSVPSAGIRILRAPRFDEAHVVMGVFSVAKVFSGAT